MAIESIKEHSHISGSYTESKFQARVAFQVITTAKEDGSDTIRRHAQFRIGSGYSFGNDSNPAMQLRSVEPELKQKDGHRRIWLVECLYATPDPGEQSDPGQQPPGGSGTSDFPPTTDSPSSPANLDLPEESLEVVFMTKTELIDNAEFVETFFVGNDGTRGVASEALGGEIAKKRGPILNSAFMPHVPAPEWETMYPVYRMTGTVSIKELTAAMRTLRGLGGAINGSLANIFSPRVKGDRLFVRCEKYTLKVVGIHIGRIEAGAAFARVGLGYELAYNEKTWLLDVLDEGMAVKADASGFNNRVSEGNIPETVTVRDERGGVTTQPVLLDGAGGINRNKRYVYYNKWIPDAGRVFTYDFLPKLYEGM